ncbi:MAG: hypothetical protein ABIR81_02555 [Ginsengibacter sp.]
MSVLNEWYDIGYYLMLKRVALYLRLMIKNRIISFVLVLILSIQMLPLVQIGVALSCNQWTEELPHNSDDTTKNDSSVAKFILLTPHHFIAEFSCSAENIYIHSSDQIPSNHSTDIVSPPPDFVA